MLTGFDLCRAAMAVEGITAPEQNVLTALAIMSNNDAQCWPGINGSAGITGKTKLSERTVQRALQALKDAGHLNWVDKPGRGRVYVIHPRHSDTPAEATPVTVTPRQPDTRHSGTPVTVTPTPVTVAPNQPLSTIPQKASPSSVAREPSKRPSRVPSDFVPTPAPGSLTAKAMDAWPPGEREEQIEHFVDHHTAKATTSLDWQASWRTWVKNWKQFNGNHTRLPERQSGAQPNLRGSRPDPALDLLHASQRAGEAQRAADRGGDHRQSGTSLPSIWTG